MDAYTINYDALLFHADGRKPSIVSLMTTPSSTSTHHATYTSPPSRVPHPEIYMDCIPGNTGIKVWKYQRVDALDGMTLRFTQPYIVFYPAVLPGGRPFPINKAIKEIQEEAKTFREATAWRGNIVVAKYRGDHPFNSMVNASMADFPLLKNHFMKHPAPKIVGAQVSALAQRSA